MEFLGSVWQIGLIALAAGILIGILAYRVYSASTSETDQVRAELDETRDELQHYKANVQSHFDRTAELVNELTQNYARVYRHLADGAHTLGDSKTLTNLLEQQPGRVVITVDEQIGDVSTRVADAAVSGAQEPSVAALDDEARIAAARAGEIDFVVGEASTGEGEASIARGKMGPGDPDLGDFERADWEPVSPAADIESTAPAEKHVEKQAAPADSEDSARNPRNKSTEPA